MQATANLLPAWEGSSYYEHQDVGIRWMMSLEEGYVIPDTPIVLRGGILGDKMGVGKTIQALGLIANGAVGNTLIVTPLAVKKQWEDELIRANVNLYTPQEWGGKWVIQTNKNSENSVYLAHYDKIANKPSLTKLQHFDRIIIDEAHTIRNSKTKKSQAILSIDAKYKWALTATPILNSMIDVLTYLKFIGYPVIGTNWLPEHEACIKQVYLSRIQSECKAPPGLIMPPRPIEQTLLMDFTDAQEELVYGAILKNEEAQWRKASAKGDKLEMFSIYMRLRQVSINPQIYTNARRAEKAGWTGPVFSGPSRKFMELSHLMRDAYEAKEQHRWIVFCQFHSEMDLLKTFLKALPFTGSILEYHGGMSISERNSAIKRSKQVSPDGKQDVFLIKLKAGSTGLNLQHYDRIVFMSPWWTPAEMEQAKGRAVRIGQTKVVEIYNLMLKAENTFNIDSFMMGKVLEKKDLADEFESWSVHRKEEQINLTLDQNGADD
jgi:SNF2 family DNA or RNA helicase